MKTVNIITYEIKKNIFWWLYYAFMMLVLVSWSNHEVAPSEAYRYIYMVLFALPFFFDRHNNFLSFFFLFYTVGLYGIGFSYLPNRTMPYALILIALTIKNKRLSIKLSGWNRILILGFLIVIVDFFGLFGMESSDIISDRRIWPVSIVCLLPLFLSADKNRDADKLSFSFIFISLILSLQFILLGSTVAVSYDYASGVDRVAWMDPNYFAPIVGVGLLMSVLTLLEKENGLLMKILLISTIVISAVTIILSASRGAVLAVAISLAIIISMSKANTYYKIFMIVAGAILIILLYNSGFFELLEYRLSDASNLSSGAGRYDIWSKKLDSFIDNGNILSIFFGVGYNAAFRLGFREGMGFHNDFLAFLCSYGFVGLILFLIVLLWPVFMTKKENRTHVLPFTVFLLVVGTTVEPLCNLYMPYWFLLFYIYVKVFQYKNITK